MKIEVKTTDEAGNVQQYDVSSCPYWMDADKETVNKFLKENISDMDEYKCKKQKIMQKIYQRAERRFEKSDGITNRFFMWTMVAMAIFGLITTWQHC